ncbi:hypothetical protein BDW22DRAFT_1395958 [Trametopsis cervina]|nr:hypothetical protein BDW22DRAFT_1395958 [Trametopsis cervina]
MSALNRGPSLPVWTPLTVASRSTTTISESGSPASSQDMHDELAETPAPSIPPSPVIRKRKGDGDGKGVNSVPKRRRMSTVATLNGDVPASAHTPPVARPGFTQPSGSGLSIPSKPNVPTSDAGRNAFSRARGLATSTSKMPQDSDSESPSEQRSCARKSAAMHPPFRRNKAQPANLSPWKEGMGLNTGSPPPLTASSRLLNGHIARKSKGKAHEPYFSDNSIDFPTVSGIIKDYNRRHPRFMAHSQASPPGRPGNKRRQTLADPPDAIEISSSDEGTGQLRQSHASIGYPEETGKEIITIESDDEYPASPTVARRSPTVHLTTNTFDIDDHSISAEVAPEPATRNLLTPHSVLLPDESWQGDSIPPDQRILPDQEHEAIGKYSASSLPYVSLNAIATEYSSVIPASPMHIGQSYADVPSRTHEQSDMHNPTQSVLVQDDHETNPFTRVDVTAVRSPSAATLQRFDKTLTRKTSLFKSASTSHSVEVSSMENLVPSLHDMSIMSSGGMDSVNRSPSRSVDARQVQAVDTDMFDHWRNIDGSGSSTHVTKSPTSSDVGSASTYGHVVSTEEHVSLAPPSTPKTVAVLDLKTLVAQSTRKQTTRKSMSRRLKPASDSGIQFTFTPLVISPVSAVTSLISAPVAPTSQEMDTLEAPGIHGGPSNIDVGGHLYGGDGGFFKAVYGRKSSGTASKASSTHVSPPAMQGSSPTFSLGESSPAEISIPLPTEPQRETPLPISSPRAHTSKERSNTPSSGQRFSLASLLEEGLYQREHFDSAPPKPAYIITEQESSRRQTQISPVPSTSETSLPAKKRSLPIPRISRMSSLSGVRSVLEKALAEAQSRPTKQTASVIDLTLSDSEPDNEEPAESVAMEDLGSARIAARPDPGVTGCSLPVLEASDAPDSRPVEDVRMGSHSPLPDTIYTTSVVTESTITQQSGEHLAELCGCCLRGKRH